MDSEDQGEMEGQAGEFWQKGKRRTERRAAEWERNWSESCIWFILIFFCPNSNILNETATCLLDRFHLKTSYWQQKLSSAHQVRRQKGPSVHWTAVIPVKPLWHIQKTALMKGIQGNQPTSCPKNVQIEPKQHLSQNDMSQKFSLSGFDWLSLSTKPTQVRYAWYVWTVSIHSCDVLFLGWYSLPLISYTFTLSKPHELLIPSK